MFHYFRNYSAMPIKFAVKIVWLKVTSLIDIALHSRSQMRLIWHFLSCSIITISRTVFKLWHSNFSSVCDFAGTLVPVPKNTECYWDVNLILFNWLDIPIPLEPNWGHAGFCSLATASWGQRGILMGAHWCYPFPKIGPMFSPPEYHQMPTWIPPNAHLLWTCSPPEYHQMPTSCECFPHLNIKCPPVVNVFSIKKNNLVLSL